MLLKQEHGPFLIAKGESIMKGYRKYFGKKILWFFITLVTGKYTKKDIVATVIALLFIFRFVAVTM